MMQRVIEVVESHLQLPAVRIPQFDEVATATDIEEVAENCRREWGLGLGPISNMTRLAEHVGAIVTTFSGVSREVDALSFAGVRPVIVRNDAKAHLVSHDHNWSRCRGQPLQQLNHTGLHVRLGQQVGQP